MKLVRLMFEEWSADELVKFEMLCEHVLREFECREEVSPNRQHDESRAKYRRADPRVLCVKSLTVQIEELMRSLSPAQRDRPWSMEELVARLQGRYNARPHPMNVGQALRVLGFKQKRDWGRGGEGRRYWSSP